LGVERAKRPPIDSLRDHHLFVHIVNAPVNTPRKIPAVVLGGGISGLTAARILQENSQEYVLLERCPTLGGLTRTIEVNEYCFDYTGHFLHLSRYASPGDIPYANLRNEEWTQVRRRSCCFVGDKFISAPIQYNLSELPSPLFEQCVESYENRPALLDDDCATFRDYLVSGFGAVLADLFLIPQNEKTMAIPLDRLSKRAVRRFFPAPDETLVRAGIRGEPSNGGYNSTFWYPKVGGISRLVAGLRSGLEECLVNQDVIALSLRNRTAVTKNTATFSWDTLFSSMPLKALCEMSEDDGLVSAAASLSHSSTISFNIGLRAPLRPEFSGIHWLYVPDRRIPFYRVGFYSNIGRGTCTPDRSSIYVEVGATPEDLERTTLVADLQPMVILALQDLGWLDIRDVDCVVAHTMRCAYVHHTPQRDTAVKYILDRLREYQVFPIGRYGTWDYTSMEDSMESARQTVMEALQTAMTGQVDAA